MEIIGIVAGGIIILILVWIFGFSVGNSDDNTVRNVEAIKKVVVDGYRCQCGCGGNWCNKVHCSPECYRYNYPFEPKSASEAVAFSRQYELGYRKGHKEGLEDAIFMTKRNSEFILKFQDAMKPLEKLKSEFNLVI